MKVMEGLKYTRSHEWIRKEGDVVYIGISDFAQSHLGTIVFVELPELDSTVNKGESLAVVESVKAASDVYTPLSGTVREVNEALVDDPESINNDPYGSWFVSLELSNPAELDGLLDAKDYENLCQQGE